MCESAWPTWRISQSTSKRLASRAIETYVRRNVCGRSARRPRAARWVDASVAAFADDLGGALARHASSLSVREQEGVGPSGLVGAAEPVYVGDDLFEQVGADLDFADSGLGLASGMRKCAPLAACSEARGYGCRNAR